MAITLNSVLMDAGLDPTQVALIRHKDNRASKGRTPYELWLDHRKLFEGYQSLQRISKRKIFSKPYWAIFIVDAFDDTMFAGIYSARYKGLLKRNRPAPHIEGDVIKKGSCDEYELRLDRKLNELIGRVFIDWGPGALAWA